MGTVRTYFLAPGWDYPANSVLLGSVITNPTQPQLALFKPSPQDFDSPVSASEKAQFAMDLARSGKSHGPGLFGTFLNQHGLGSEDSFHYDRKTVRSYSFQHMQSRSFEPSESFRRKAVAETDRVAAFCRASDFKAPVYMVTGLKAIQGAGVTISSRKGNGWRLSLGLNIGSSDDHTLQDGGGSEGGPSPIVFAFQLTEIRLSPSGLVSSPDDLSSTNSDPSNIQQRLDGAFGEGAFVVMDGFDEADGTPCRIIGSSQASFDLLTASSAKIDPSTMRRASLVE
ncbi:hypothetical protein B0H66DRAFT_358923 [Apodospora peruviana]|uniref:Uncharacterized protein n=1 Tax=Apodospora peruviana TaxID=516989 RepID=A0AAE0HVL0_9PEZI|nr:hypothetical protein B0H66DRAFT_358923 [Apodospora peruviana]